MWGRCESQHVVHAKTEFSSSCVTSSRKTVCGEENAVRFVFFFASLGFSATDETTKLKRCREHFVSRRLSVGFRLSTSSAHLIYLGGVPVYSFSLKFFFRALTHFRFGRSSFSQYTKQFFSSRIEQKKAKTVQCYMFEFVV